MPKLTILVALLFPALALGAPHGVARVRMDGPHSTLLVSKDRCGGQVPATSQVRRSPRTLEFVRFGQKDPSHRLRHRRRQLAVPAERQALFLEERSAPARLGDRRTFSRQFFLPGRSPPSC